MPKIERPHDGQAPKATPEEPVRQRVPPLPPAAELPDGLKPKQSYVVCSQFLREHLEQLLRAQFPLLRDWQAKKYVRAGLWPIVQSTETLKQANIAVAAPVSAGKSTLLNGICEYPILPTAPGTTSPVPVYISRAAGRDDESVTIIPYLLEEEQNGHKKFLPDTARQKRYRAGNITPDMFRELFDYMLFLIQGEPERYESNVTVVENVAYFMDTVQHQDVIFFGTIAEKAALKREAFALSYAEKRHRLLLLMILLCVYVKQNADAGQLTPYDKEVNVRRARLLKRLGFPEMGDYRVDLHWNSASIPQGVTLIDLPGTGAATVTTERQQSHDAIVKGILFNETDAIWILPSANGIVEPNLNDAIHDAVAMDKTKSVILIYNCMDGAVNNMTPIKDFVQLIPCLVGQRCFVVNAMAGEFKFSQNGIPLQNTHSASQFRARLGEFLPPEEQFNQQLSATMETAYAKKTAPTYISFQAQDGSVQVRQEPETSYSLKDFLHRALIEYVAKLHYELALKDVVRETNFFKTVYDELINTIRVMEGIQGGGAALAASIENALAKAWDNTHSKYQAHMNTSLIQVNQSLEQLGKSLAPNLLGKFIEAYNALIGRIQAEWRTLVTDGSPNRLEANFFGNYPLGISHPNWEKFTRVRDTAEGMISITSFSTATDEVERALEVYRDTLNAYIGGLRTITTEFHTDYVQAFLSEFDQQKQKICRDENGKVINDELEAHFHRARVSLKKAINGKLDSVCMEISESFGVLTAPGGMFDEIVQENQKAFRLLFSDQVLDGLRKRLRSYYTESNKIWLFIDRLDVQKFNNLLASDFADPKEECKGQLIWIMEQLYGTAGLEKANFCQMLPNMMTRFNGNVLTHEQKGVESKIRATHNSVTDLVKFGADQAVDLTSELQKVVQSIETWLALLPEYAVFGSGMVEDEPGENARTLVGEYREAMALVSACKVPELGESDGNHESYNLQGGR